MKDRVGQYISTKRVGSWAREDLTHLYKYPEKTEKERKAFQTAYSFGAGAKNWAGFLNVEEEGDDLVLGKMFQRSYNVMGFFTFVPLEFFWVCTEKTLLCQLLHLGIKLFYNISLVLGLKPLKV